MLLLVQTSGSFSLIDASQKVSINKNTPTVVRSTPFIEERMARGDLKTLGQLKDTATQEEMSKYLADSGNRDLAVASFLAAFGLNAEPVVVVEPPPSLAPMPQVKSPSRKGKS